MNAVIKRIDEFALLICGLPSPSIHYSQLRMYTIILTPKHMGLLPCAMYLSSLRHFDNASGLPLLLGAVS